jgi:hypothetical protein
MVDGHLGNVGYLERKMDIRTIVADLYTNTAHSVFGLAGIGAALAYDETTTLDAHRHIAQKATGVSVTIDGNKFRVAKPNLGQNRHGYVLGYAEGTASIATLTRAHGRICVSPDYSGCLFSVYHYNGTYKCCHTARDDGDNDVHVLALRAYAALQNWVLVHEVPTRNDNLNGPNGTQVNGCNTTLVVTRISYSINPNVVRTVRLRMNYRYQSIHRVRWTTPVGGATVQD